MSCRKWAFFLNLAFSQTTQSSFNINVTFIPEFLSHLLIAIGTCGLGCLNRQCQSLALCSWVSAASFTTRHRYSFYSNPSSLLPSLLWARTSQNRFLFFSNFCPILQCPLLEIVQPMLFWQMQVVPFTSAHSCHNRHLHENPHHSYLLQCLAPCLHHVTK